MDPQGMRPVPDPCASVDEAGVCRILLVDDSAFDARALEHLLGDIALRHDLSVVTTLHEGTECAHGQGFDVMIVDYRLPDGDGTSLLGAVRDGQGPNRATPAILITGDDDEDLRQRGRDLGFASFLTKSHMTPQRLALAVAVALKTPASDP